ncbi:MAG: chemotaxis protein CheW [Polyangiaceae bacterium]|jgi:chemotaxis protein histidine kinase CheA
MPNPDAIRRLIEGFVGEASDLCESVTRDLLAIERGGKDLVARYENVARSLHTLKGGAGTLGLEDLERLAHRLEDALLAHQAAKEPIPSRDADALLRGLDAFMDRLRAHADGRAAELDSVEDVLAALRPAGEQPSVDVADEAIAGLDPTPEQPEPSAIARGQQAWRVAPEHVIALTREVERLRFLRLRVDERRHALARARSALGPLSRAHDAREADEILAGVDAALAADAQDVADLVDVLEQGVKDISTQPIRVIFEPLHRAVRDLCRSTGKEARLSFVGGETCLDRRVLEALKGPIVHLIRNAVVHGIEAPAERRDRGKHEEGAIVIRVEQQGNVVFIEVSDDGAGLKLEAIKRAAIERKIATEAELARMPPEKVHELVFLPAVSTAPEVTATSGRGIGMDAVKKGIEQLHGQIELQTTYGQGTRILLTFPAGLGSSPILIVRVEDRDFGLPMASVESVVAASPSHLTIGRGETRLKHQDELLLVVDLGAALGLRPLRPVTGGRLLIVHSKGRRVALWVNDVVGDMNLAIRPLPIEVAHVPLYQGASSLAGGTLVLIMRPDWITGVRDPATMSRTGREAFV